MRFLVIEVPLYSLDSGEDVYRKKRGVEDGVRHEHVGVVCAILARQRRGFNNINMNRNNLLCLHMMNFHNLRIRILLYDKVGKYTTQRHNPLNNLVQKYRKERGVEDGVRHEHVGDQVEGERHRDQRKEAVAYEHQPSCRTPHFIDIYIYVSIYLYIYIYTYIYTSMYIYAYIYMYIYI